MKLDLRGVWAIVPEALDALCAADVAAAAPEVPAQQRVRTVAVIPIRGVIQHRPDIFMSIFGGTSSVSIARAVQAAASDDSVDTIVLDVDSPGGEVHGVTEAAAAVFEARSRKRIVAIANGVMASAAYWIGSAAHEVVATPSGEVGSIGVIAMHQDVSAAMEAAGVKTTIISAGRHKADGSPLQPLTDEARAAIQADVDSYYDLFVRDVARHRGTTPAQVRSGYGQGMVLTAQAAKSAGLVDRVESMDALLVRLAGGKAKGSNARRADVEGRRLALLRLG